MTNNRKAYADWAKLEYDAESLLKDDASTSWREKVAKKLAYDYLDTKQFNRFVKAAIMSEEINVNLATDGNFTIADLEFKEGGESVKHLYGAAKRNPTDPYIPSRGRKIAIIRALRNI